jgi:hypothetical protein
MAEPLDDGFRSSRCERSGRHLALTSAETVSVSSRGASLARPAPARGEHTHLPTRSGSGGALVNAKGDAPSLGTHQP